MSDTAIVRWQLTITGTVQGVGFRPHVQRLAAAAGLTGFVGNDSAGVFVEVQGHSADLVAFRQRIVDLAPPLARVATVDTIALPPISDDDAAGGFRIVPSRSSAGPSTSAPPDTVTCDDCLAEMRDPADRRFGHPFITCTNCGPRFTIITALPYDRPATTMADFPLCPACAQEFHDPTDRRFHAQPVSCRDCGPQIALHDEGRRVAGTDRVIARVQHLLADGLIVAVKGVGGYHLACRADDAAAVARLRRHKRRPHKPFAVMVRSVDVARRLANLSTQEVRLLSSAEGPIVLASRRADAPLAREVTPGNPLVGVMLPPSPLHHLLLAGGTDVLVMTSGNLSDEPICIDDDQALDRLGGIADAFLAHDRPIAVPCDDSVVRVDPDGAVTLIRRSRGWVPTPIDLPISGLPALAVGGQLKTTVALSDGRRAWLSQHVGDMGSIAALAAFQQTIERFQSLHDITPTQVAVDAHPEYLTRKWALANRSDLSVIEVQHHHAHIAAVMAEHGVPADDRVIGFAFDGTGYGLDGTIWGGEVLITDYTGAERWAHLSTTRLPGGDAAIRLPRRVAISHLVTSGIELEPDLPPVAATPPAELQILTTQLDRNLNCVATSSMGRLFDAVASLIGVRHEVTFEAQAAIELEILALQAQQADIVPPPLTLPLRTFEDGTKILHAPELLRSIVDASTAGLTPAAVALGFHLAVAQAVTACAESARQETGIGVVALSGGVFANALLTRECVSRLVAAGFRVLRHRLVPPNDGGLALGQIAVAAARNHKRTRP